MIKQIQLNLCRNNLGNPKIGLAVLQVDCDFSVEHDPQRKGNRLFGKELLNGDLGYHTSSSASKINHNFATDMSTSKVNSSNGSASEICGLVFARIFPMGISSPCHLVVPCILWWRFSGLQKWGLSCELRDLESHENCRRQNWCCQLSHKKGTLGLGESFWNGLAWKIIYSSGGLKILVYPYLGTWFHLTNIFNWVAEPPPTVIFEH